MWVINFLQTPFYLYAYEYASFPLIAYLWDDSERKELNISATIFTQMANKVNNEKQHQAQKVL